MPPPWLFAVVAGVAGLVCALGIRALVPVLRRRAVLDHPNERSLHAVPTPRGGGIALIGTIILAWAGLDVAGESAPAGGIVLLGAVALAAMSWIDDLGGLSPLARLLGQVAAVGLSLWWSPLPGVVFQGWLPPAVDTMAAALAWLWFINLFNFMDGIDGLAGSEAAAIAAGLFVFAIVGVGADSAFALAAAAAFGATIGFLVWNWAPARIFMGDVGSVPLGFLLGYVLLALMARGWWKAAVILPLYFIADATITLARRAARGERVWRAHREHFYQRAVQNGLGHAAVTLRVIAANLGLIACAWAAENGFGPAALAAAVAIVALLLADLGKRR